MIHVMQLLGANGAGKSSVFRTLVRQDPAAVYIKGVRAPFIVCPSTKLLTIGNYLTGPNTVGLDAIKNKIGQLLALEEAVYLAHVHRATVIGLEGVIALTRPFLDALIRRVPVRTFVHLDLPFSLCMARVIARSGNPNQRGGSVADKHARTWRLATWLRDRGERVVVVDAALPQELVAQRVWESVRRPVRTAWHARR